ncbi:helix-turn-helix domain-containing protein [Pseudonocardia nigra]|uniref:helix-turn-helix domain-containing protein n=1 Tax=Pseudonocardia nigra TaxID=1921578 RepID=UPI001C5E142C|nr:helix-turn-helix domain-containing protein [Pseudonocardia nigra]
MTQRSHAVSGETPVTVEMLLGEPLLRGSLVAGEAGLHREVTWCLPLSEIGPVRAPNREPAADLAGVVVQAPSTALSTRDGIRELVDSLTRRGAAALLIWPAEEGGAVDLDTAAPRADAASLPLLLLRREADYRQVSHLIAMKVLSQSAHVLEYSMRVHRILGEVFAHGSGLVAMARTMSHLARTPVYVLGMGGETVAHADAGLPAGSVPTDVGHSVVTQLVAQHRRERERSAATGGGTPEHSRLVELTIGDATVHAVAAPVTVAGEPYGIVVLLEHTWPADEHDLAQHRVIAEQGATLVGSEMLRQRSVRAAEESARDDFVDALLHGRFTDQHELAARSRHYQFDLEGRFAAFVVTAQGLMPDRRPDARRTAAAARAASGAAPDPDLLTLTAQIGGMIVVLRQLPSDLRTPRDDGVGERQTCTVFAGQLHRLMRDRLGDSVRVAYGRAGTGAAGVATSYREARTAVALAQRVQAPAVCGYTDLRVFAAIQEAASSDAGSAFAADVLEPLRRSDGQTGNLEQIVLAYIRESGNLNAAARALQLHRNTMLYKLDRASRALQMDVRNAETQFMIWLAHHIDMLNEVHSALRNELHPPAG